MKRISAKRAGEVETIQIRFQVDRAVQGARAGQPITIREWAGLWAAGERYRVGERVMLFLYPPSKLGLTSPVGGGQGRFAVDDQGRVLIEGDEPPPAAGPVSVQRGPMKRPVAFGSFYRAIRQAAEE